MGVEGSAVLSAGQFRVCVFCVFCVFVFFAIYAMSAYVIVSTTGTALSPFFGHSIGFGSNSTHRAPN